MKTSLLFIVFLFLVNINYAQWNLILESDKYIFTDVCFLDDSTGYVSGGVMPYATYNFSPGIILKTKDGGDNWDTIITPTFAHNIHFYDEMNCLVVSNKYLCYKSQDGGQTWDTIWTGYSGNTWGGTTGYYPFYEISHLTIVDSMNCYITKSGGWGELGKSSDGGNTWTFGIEPSNVPNLGIILASPVVAVNDNPSKLFAGVMYKSYDGGNTWYENDSLVPPFADYVWLRDIDYLDSKNGWFASSAQIPVSGDIYHVGAIGKTVDGGNTWSETFFDEIILEVTSIDVVSLKTIYASIRSGFLEEDVRIYFLKSPDNGAHWYYQETFPKVDCTEMRKVYAVNDFVAFGLGYNIAGKGYIFKTENGGGPLFEAPQLGDKENVFNESLELFPNPTSNEFQLSKRFSYPVTMKIYSMDGRLKSVSEFKSNELITKDISTFSPGLYKIVLISLEGKYYASSLVKY